MARNGWDCKGAAAVVECPVQKVGDRIWKHFPTFVQLEQLDPARTRATLLRAMYRAQGRPMNGAGDIWTPTAVETCLGRHPGTGKQTLERSTFVVAQLMLANPLLTTIDLAQAAWELEPMDDREIELRRLMLMGKLDSHFLHPRAKQT